MTFDQRVGERGGSSRWAAVAGIALIVCPLVALLLKSIHPGWMLVILLYASPVLVVGYVVQVIIAASALVPRRGILRGKRGRRAIIAAGITSLAVLACGVLLVDGGDDGTYASVLTDLLGTSSTREGEAQSMSLFGVAASLLTAGWLWLVIEWVVALVQSRRARRLGVSW